MKRVFLLLVVSTIILSCSNDDDAQSQEQFFNLHEGNLWVYRQYGVNESSGVSEFTNHVDSVRVVGQMSIEGESYFNVQHKVYKHQNLIDERIEYLRADENGHLINSEGLVKHPGVDTEYQSVRMVGEVEIKYTLQPKYNINIDGVIYERAFSYLGYIDELQPAPSRDMAHEVLYVPTIGIVSEKYIFMGTAENYMEDRLVYYEIN